MIFRWRVCVYVYKPQYPTCDWRWVGQDLQWQRSVPPEYQAACQSFCNTVKYITHILAFLHQLKSTVKCKIMLGYGQESRVNVHMRADFCCEEMLPNLFTFTITVNASIPSGFLTWYSNKNITFRIRGLLIYVDAVTKQSWFENKANWWFYQPRNFFSCRFFSASINTYNQQHILLYI